MFNLTYKAYKVILSICFSQNAKKDKRKRIHKRKLASRIKEKIQKITSKFTKSSGRERHKRAGSQKISSPRRRRRKGRQSRSGREKKLIKTRMKTKTRQLSK